MQAFPAETKACLLSPLKVLIVGYSYGSIIGAAAAVRSRVATHAGLLCCGFGCEFGFAPRSAIKQVQLATGKPRHNQPNQIRNQTLDRQPSDLKPILRGFEIVPVEAAATGI